MKIRMVALPQHPQQLKKLRPGGRIIWIEDNQPEKNKIRLRHIAAACALVCLTLAFWRELAEPNFNHTFNIEKGE